MTALHPDSVPAFPARMYPKEKNGQRYLHGGTYTSRSGNMKTLFKLFAFAAIVLFAAATIIKLVQGTSYKEAVGIMEEFCKEIREKCRCCARNAEEA